MRVGLVAGESSGDVLGAGLITALQKRVPDAGFEGVAGPAMQAAGCEAWADAEELAVMGLVEPLVHLPRLISLRRELVRRWRREPPDVFVGIDAPDFNLGLEHALRKSGIRTVHYVSPQVWAWRPGRIRTIGRAVDRVLCLLPFEADLYAEHGMDAVFVGHPKADSLSPDVDVAAARESLGLPSQDSVVAVLPGSRRSEVTRLAPVFAAAAARILDARPDVRFVTPVATAALRSVVDAAYADAGIAGHCTLLDGRSVEAMSAADVVLLASGTAALESALLGKPTVAAYRVAPTSAWIFRTFRLLRVKHYTMPNLLTAEPQIPEFIQEDATAEAIADELIALLNDPARREAIRMRFAKLQAELALGADERAADAVMELAHGTVE